MILYVVEDFFEDGHSYCGQAYDRKRDAQKLLAALKQRSPEKGWHITTEEDPTRH